MANHKNSFEKEIAETKTKARAAIQATEKALKKHLGLIKKRERIASIVAMIERLRGDLAGDDPKIIQAHIKKLDELTKGFVERTLKRK